MATPPTASPEIVAHLRSLPARVDREQFAAQILLRYFGFNDAWFRRHVRRNSKDPAGYFRLKSDLSNQVVVRTRLQILANNLWNLSEPLIPGFIEALERWTTQMDEGDAHEVNLAAHLKRWGVPFVFHQRKSDEKTYDFDVVALNGETIAVEGKCRSATADIDWTKLGAKLRKAAKQQLPKGRPGALFVQLGQEWLEGKLPDGWQAGKADKLDALLEDLFRNHSRVVAIVLFVFTQTQIGETQQWHIWYGESTSALHAFDKTKDWAILGPHRQTTSEWKSLTDLVESYIGST